MRKLGLTSKILIGLFLGMLFGVILSKMPGSYIKDTVLLGGIINVIGNGFTKAIKMMVVPLVFVSLVCGVSAMEDIKKLGRIGFKTMGFYLMTTAVAICISLALGVLLKPGAGLDLGTVASQSTTIAKNQSLSEIILNMIPSNPIEAFAKGEMLQIIFFAMLTGVSISLVGEKVKPLKKLFECANEVCMKMVSVIMMFAPFGVFALITNTFSTVGADAIGSLVKYILVVLLGLLLHVVVVYGGSLKVFTKVSFIGFVRKFSKVAAVTFSTASSNASVPVSLELMEEMGVSKSIRSFTIPMGATINMDGTAIMQGVAALFIAQVYGVHLGINDMLTIVLTATLASVGTAGVPGVGMIMLSMVLQSVGLPLEGIGLIMGVERIIDMFRTTVNVMGDNTCTLVVASSEKELEVTNIDEAEVA